MPTPQPAPDEPLDFDAPGGSSPGAVACAACKRPIADEYWTVGEAVLCGKCKATVESSQVVPAGIASRAGRLGRAVLFGTGGMLAGAGVWYAVAKFANLEVGLIAILLGWLVGKAVFAGSGNRGGLRYQVLAATLTYLGIGVAYAPFAYEGLQADRAADSIAATTEVLSPAPAAPADSLAAIDPAGDEGGLIIAPDTAATPVQPMQLGLGSFLLGIGAILFLILALPVLVIVQTFPGSLISLLIYGFAVVQAWQMTRQARIAFGGPFKVGGSAPA